MEELNSDEEQYEYDSFEQESDVTIPEISDTESELDDKPSTSSQIKRTAKPSNINGTKNRLSARFTKKSHLQYASSADDYSDEEDVIVKNVKAQINTKPMSLDDMDTSRSSSTTSKQSSYRKSSIEKSVVREHIKEVSHIKRTNSSVKQTIQRNPSKQEQVQHDTPTATRTECKADKEQNEESEDDCDENEEEYVVSDDSADEFDNDKCNNCDNDIKSMSDFDMFANFDRQNLDHFMSHEEFLKMSEEFKSMVLNENFDQTQDSFAHSTARKKFSGKNGYMFDDVDSTVSEIFLTNHMFPTVMKEENFDVDEDINELDDTLTQDTVQNSIKCYKNNQNFVCAKGKGVKKDNETGKRAQRVKEPHTMVEEFNDSYDCYDNCDSYNPNETYESCKVYEVDENGDSYQVDEADESYQVTEAYHKNKKDKNGEYYVDEEDEDEAEDVYEDENENEDDYESDGEGEAEVEEQQFEYECYEKKASGYIDKNKPYNYNGVQYNKMSKTPAKVLETMECVKKIRTPQDAVKNSKNAHIQESKKSVKINDVKIAAQSGQTGMVAENKTTNKTLKGTELQSTTKAQNVNTKVTSERKPSKIPVRIPESKTKTLASKPAKVPAKTTKSAGEVPDKIGLKNLSTVRPVHSEETLKPNRSGRSLQNLKNIRINRPFIPSEDDENTLVPDEVNGSTNSQNDYYAEDAYESGGQYTNEHIFKNVGRHGNAEIYEDEYDEDEQDFNCWDYRITSHTPTELTEQAYTMQITVVDPKKRVKGRKSFSFTNSRLREIERTNKILLKKILSQKPTYARNPNPRKRPMQPKKSNVQQSRTNASVNRKKQQTAINIENNVNKRRIAAIAANIKPPKFNLI